MSSIQFFEISPIERGYLRKSVLARHALAFCDERIEVAAPAALRKAEVLSTFIYSRVTACRKRGVSVVDVPFCGENMVAERPSC